VERLKFIQRSKQTNPGADNMYTELANAIILLPIIAAPFCIAVGFLVLKIKGE